MAEAPLSAPRPYSRAWWRVQKEFRFLVAFIAVSSGLIVAIVDLAVVTAYKPPRVGIVPHRERENEERRQSTHFAITIFSVAYATGVLVYRWFGAGDDAQSLHRWSRWHLLLLHFIGSSWLIFDGWMAWKQIAVIRPSFIVVVFLVAMTLWDVMKSRKPLPAEGESRISLP